MQAYRQPVVLLAGAPAPAPAPADVDGLASPVPAPAPSPVTGPSLNPYADESQACAQPGGLCIQSAAPGNPLACFPGLLCEWHVQHEVWATACTDPAKPPS